MDFFFLGGIKSTYTWVWRRVHLRVLLCSKCRVLQCHNFGLLVYESFLLHFAMVDFPGLLQHVHLLIIVNRLLVMASYWRMQFNHRVQKIWMDIYSIDHQEKCTNRTWSGIWSKTIGVKRPPLVTLDLQKLFEFHPSNINIANNQSITLMLCFPFLFTVVISAFIGENVTLPCKLDHKDSSFGSIGIRLKWTKLGEDDSLDEDVFLSMGLHENSYGSYVDRTYLADNDSSSGALTIAFISKEDAGRYRCEIINGMTDTMQEVTLNVESVPVDGKCSIISCF